MECITLNLYQPKTCTWYINAVNLKFTNLAVSTEIPVHTTLMTIKLKGVFNHAHAMIESK